MRVEPSLPPPPPATTEHVEVVADDGVHLHATRHRGRLLDGAPAASRAASGGGPTVVLAHGYALTSQSWAAQVAALTASGLDVVTYDQRGHGDSGQGEAAHYTIEQLGRDLAAVLDQAVPTGPVVLAGHSMGGMTLMSFARQCPDVVADRVCAAAFIGTSAGQLLEAGYGFGQHVVGRRLAHLTGTWVPALLDRVVTDPARTPPSGRAVVAVESLLARRNNFSRAADPALTRAVVDMHHRTPLAALGAFLGGFSTHDEAQALAAFAEVPTLVLVGEVDRLTPPTHSEALLEALPSATHVVVEQAGHIVMMERADAVSEALVALVEQVGCDDGPDAPQEAP